MTALNIRDISPELKRELKIEAAKRGLTLRAYVLLVLNDAVESSILKGRERMPKDELKVKSQCA